MNPHTEDCAMLDDGPCTCGSDEALDEVLGDQHAEEIEQE